MVSLSSSVCWPHTGGSLALLLCFCCKGWLGPRGRMGEAAVAEPLLLVLLWEERCWGTAVWCRFGTKPPSGQCRAGYGESYYGAVPHNNIYVLQHHLLLILVRPGWTKLRWTAFLGFLPLYLCLKCHNTGSDTMKLLVPSHLSPEQYHKTWNSQAQNKPLLCTSQLRWSHWLQLQPSYVRYPDSLVVTEALMLKQFYVKVGQAAEVYKVNSVIREMSVCIKEKCKNKWLQMWTHLCLSCG